jgi:PHD/YefM family antitoxin component YafN of YafNO toxin-antitoxin module
MIPIWVIYRRPTDFPTSNYVMREHYVITNEGASQNVVMPTEYFHTAQNIEELRRKIPRGKQRVLRRDDDEPQIVEWWF